MFARKSLIWLAILATGLVLAGFSFLEKDKQPNLTDGPDISESPNPSSLSSPTSTATPKKQPIVSRVPLPTGGDNKTTFLDEPVPWHLLLNDASCVLKGEIKFLTANTYNNQDAEFIYNGIDHPGRNVEWTITPDDGSLSVGPNIFSKLFIPNGSSLLGVFPVSESKNKRYELTATIAYGRLVDKTGNFVTVGGDVKVFKKQCDGKTTIVFP